MPILPSSRPLAPLARAVAAGALLLAARALQAQQTPSTADVFRRYADRTVRIQVVEAGSAAKASLGTGFFVDASGHVVTNYHVVSRLVTDRARYRAEYADAAGRTHALTPVAIDVVNDLAVLSSPQPATAWFTLAPATVEQGARLYSLGHPRDLGLSIVEGTYNGLLEHTLYPKIHFTGALNPGMSGGPTLADGGAVIGVNVSTEGNEVSFLVPVARAIALVDRARAAGFKPSRDLMADVGRQILAYQNEYLARMFEPGTPTVTLGAFTVPTTPAPFFRCWADADRHDNAPYETVDHQCSTDDYLYISGEQSSGVVELKHRVVSSHKLNALQFSSLYSAQLQQDRTPLFAGEDDVTRYECETRNVANAERPGRPSRKFRAQLCVRRYRKLAGLYDAVLKAAALGTSGTGLVTTLTMSGVSMDNVERLTSRYLETISWRSR